MPFRMVFANPIALAALAVVAIGVITYQILNRQKHGQKRVPVRGRIRGRDDDDDGPHRPGKRDKGPRGPKGPGIGKEGSVKTSNDDDGSGSPCGPETPGNGNEGSVKTSNDPRSEKPNNDSSSGIDPITEIPSKDSSSGVDPISEIPSKDSSSGVRKRNIATQSPDTPELDRMHPFSSSNTLYGNSNLPSVLNRQSGYTEEQNIKVDSNVNQLNSKTISFAANINDEDSDSDSSSETNNSLNSVGNNSGSIDLNERVFDRESSCAIGEKSATVSSSMESEEEIYKRKVCNYLKFDIKSEIFEENHVKNFNDKESDLSENDLAVSSVDYGSSGACAKKLMMCKGCLEEFANAVAYPCEHCYLCFDCAIKVHRIYKKCTVCNSVIKTFEQYKS